MIARPLSFERFSSVLLVVPCGSSFSPSAPTPPEAHRHNAPLVHARRRFLLRTPNHFLRRRTKIAIGTKRAMILGIRRKLSLRDSLRHFPHPQFRRFQLAVIPRGANRRIVFEVMEDQAVGALSKRLPRRQRIQRKLQALVGILL